MMYHVLPAGPYAAILREVSEILLEGGGYAIALQKTDDAFRF